MNSLRLLALCVLLALVPKATQRAVRIALFPPERESRRERETGVG
jgi:hypothetical protein